MFTYRKRAAKYDIPVGSCEIGPFNFSDLTLSYDPEKNNHAIVTITEIKKNDSYKYPTYIIYDFQLNNSNHKISYCAVHITENKYGICKYYGNSNLSEFGGFRQSKNINAYSEYIPSIIKEDYRKSNIILSNRDKNN